MTTSMGDAYWEDGKYIVWRNGVRYEYASPQEAAQAGRPTAAQEWEADLRSIVAQTQAAITAAITLTMTGEMNEIGALIVATAAGELLPGTTITKEAAYARAATFKELLVWLEGQVAGTGMTRKQVIFRKF